MFDRLTSFEVFRAIVRNGSLTLAGKELNMSKASISRHLKYLEDWLQTKLLLRTTRSITLTKTGELLYDQCLEVLDKVEYIEEKLPTLEKTLVGRLRVSLPPEIWNQIAPCLPDFSNKYPELNIRFYFAESFVDLYNEPYDLAIRIGSLKPSSLFARNLGKVNDVIVAAPSYLKNNIDISTPMDLQAHTCLLDMHRSPPDVWAFTDDSGVKTDVYVKGRYTLNETEAVVHAAVLGLGIANIPEYIAKTYCDSGQLVQLLKDYNAQSNDLHVLFVERKFMPEKTRVFIDFLVDVFDNKIKC